MTHTQRTLLKYRPTAYTTRTHQIYLYRHRGTHIHTHTYYYYIYVWLELIAIAHENFTHSICSGFTRVGKKSWFFKSKKSDFLFKSQLKKIHESSISNKLQISFSWITLTLSAMILHLALWWLTEYCLYLQCFDAVGWAAGRASGL